MLDVSYIHRLSDCANYNCTFQTVMAEVQKCRSQWSRGLDSNAVGFGGEALLTALQQLHKKIFS